MKESLFYAPETLVDRRWQKRFSTIALGIKWLAVNAGTKPSGYVHLKDIQV